MGIKNIQETFLNACSEKMIKDIDFEILKRLGLLPEEIIETERKKRVKKKINIYLTKFDENDIIIRKER